MTIITDPIFYLLAIPSVMILGLSKGGFAGIGQAATLLMALIMPPLEAAAMMLPIMIFQDAMAVWVYRKNWNRSVIAKMLPGAAVGIGFAWIVASMISDDAVRLLVGSITLAFCIYTWIGPKKVADETRKEFGRPSWLGAASSGFGSGFTSTICNAGAPPYQIYVLRLMMPKMIFVSTTAIFFAAVNWMKVIPYIALGQFNTKGLLTSVALLPLAVAANFAGFWLVKRTPEKLFYQITVVVMFLLSLELIRKGVSDYWA